MNAAPTPVDGMLAALILSCAVFVLACAYWVGVQASNSARESQRNDENIRKQLGLDK